MNPVGEDKKKSISRNIVWIILLLNFWWLQKEPVFAGVRELFLLGFLGEKYSLDIGQNSTLSNGNSGQEFVQLFVVTDGKLKMSWDDSGLLVIPGGVASELENLSCQVFHNSSQVNGSSSSYTFGIVAFTEKSVDTTNGELKTSPGATGLRFSLNLSALASSRHSSVFFGACSLTKNKQVVMENLVTSGLIY